MKHKTHTHTLTFLTATLTDSCWMLQVALTSEFRLSLTQLPITSSSSKLQAQDLSIYFAYILFIYCQWQFVTHSPIVSDQPGVPNYNLLDPLWLPAAVQESFGSNMLGPPNSNIFGHRWSLVGAWYHRHQIMSVGAEIAVWMPIINITGGAHKCQYT